MPHVRPLLLLLALVFLAACASSPPSQPATAPPRAAESVQPAPASTATSPAVLAATPATAPTATAEASATAAGPAAPILSPTATVPAAGMATALPGFRSPQGDEPGWLFHATGDQLPALAFAPAGQTLASGHEDGSVLLWDLATGGQIRKLEPAIPGASGNEISALAFSPDGRLLAAAKPGLGSVDLWQVATGERLPALAGGQGLADLAFSPDGRWLAAGIGRGQSADALGQVRLWSTDGWELAAVLPEVAPDLAFNPAGTTLATISGIPLAAMGPVIEPGAIELWHVPAGEPAQTIQLDGYVAGIAYDAVHDRFAANQLQPVAAAPGYASLTAILDAATGELLHTLPAPAEEGALPLFVDAVAFSPDGSHLAVGYQPNQIILWDVDKAAPVTTLAGRTAWLGRPHFGPDGSLLAASSSDGRILFWSVAGGSAE